MGNFKRSFLVTVFANLTVVCTMRPASANVSTVSGVINQATCNSPSGLGIVELIQIQGNIEYRRWYRVNSYPLCGAQVGKIAELSSISFDGLMTGQYSHAELILDENGYVTSIGQLTRVNLFGLEGEVRQVIVQGNDEANGWLEGGPGKITFGASAIPDLVERYATKYTLPSGSRPSR